MSCDTDFMLTFSCPTEDELREVVSYLDRKKARWDAWQQRGGSSSDLMERVGATSYGAVVSWGFDFGEIQIDEDGKATVEATAWANQNCTNVYISGEGGELADLIHKFPHLEILGSYHNEYGCEGQIIGYEHC